MQIAQILKIGVGGGGIELVERGAGKKPSKYRKLGESNVK